MKMIGLSEDSPLPCFDFDHSQYSQYRLQMLDSGIATERQSKLSSKPHCQSPLEQKKVLAIASAFLNFTIHSHGAVAQ